MSGSRISRFERLRDRAVPPFRADAIGRPFDDRLALGYNDGLTVLLVPDLQPSTPQIVRGSPNAGDARIYDAAVPSPNNVTTRPVSSKVPSIAPRDYAHTSSTTTPPPEGVVREVADCGVASIKLVSSVFGSARANTKTHLDINVNDKMDIKSKTSTARSVNGLHVAASDANTATLFV